MWHAFIESLVESQQMATRTRRGEFRGRSFSLARSAVSGPAAHLQAMDSSPRTNTMPEQKHKPDPRTATAHSQPLGGDNLRTPVALSVHSAHDGSVSYESRGSIGSCQDPSRRHVKPQIPDDRLRGYELSRHSEPARSPPSASRGIPVQLPLLAVLSSIRPRCSTWHVAQAGTADVTSFAWCIGPSWQAWHALSAAFAENSPAFST